MELAAAGHQHQHRDAVRADNHGIERLAAVFDGKVAEQQRWAGVGAQRSGQLLVELRGGGVGEGREEKIVEHGGQRN